MRTHFFRLIPIAVLSFLIIPMAHAGTMPSSDLSLSSRGEGVVWLQQHLIDANSGSAAVSLKAAGATGYFGPLTQSALAEYQSKNNIAPARGYFGAKTRAHISNGSVSHTSPTFSGTVSAVKVGCFVDGICSVTVDGKEVIITAGFRMDTPPVGKLIGVDSIGDIEKRIGATANVYAEPTTMGGADYTLYGNNDYYVEILPEKPAGTPITVRGTIGCLPAKDSTKPVIALCAFGIKTDDNTYYALSDDIEGSNNISSVSGDQRVEITGTLRPGVSHSVFKGEGTIEIKKLKKI